MSDNNEKTTKRPGFGQVAIVRTTPRTVLADYHRLLNLAEYQKVLDKTVDTALKINISWHFFPLAARPLPGSSTTPWQPDHSLAARPLPGSSTTPWQPDHSLAAGRGDPRLETGRF